MPATASHGPTKITVPSTAPSRGGSMRLGEPISQATENNMIQVDFAKMWRESQAELSGMRALLSAMDDKYDKALTELSLRAEKLAECKEFCETLKSRIRNLEGR